MIKWNKKVLRGTQISHDATWDSKMDWTFLNDQKCYAIDGEVDTYDWEKDTKHCGYCWHQSCNFIIQLTHGVDYFQCYKMFVINRSFVQTWSYMNSFSLLMRCLEVTYNGQS